MTIRGHRLIAAGALAVAAVAAPIAISLTVGAGQAVAGPPCLSWYGNQEDGVCLSYSNGNGVNVGTPDFGYYGPGTNPSRNRGGQGGFGFSTGPMLPGQTFTEPIG